MNELINKEQAISKMEAIKEFQNIVKSQLIEGEDFGRVPGVDKPFLFKSGAEKILSILGVSYEAPEYVEIWREITIMEVKIPYYEVVCKVRAKIGDNIVGFGIGSCNTLEKKYCYKGGQFVSDPIHYFSLKNTILKMAEKKAKVDLALHIGALSNIFTQDEDAAEIQEEKPKSAEEKQQETKNPPTKKQINFLLQLMEEKKDNVELIKKVAHIAKVVVKDEKVEVGGTFQEVSEAIDMLTKS
ncbi:MAG: hypothetical protein GYA36_21365 [Veillonellaceae bacterium]|nr:hypothetical protein [Veillonellaceae bacterium]